MKASISVIIVFLLTFISGYIAWWLAPLLCFVFFYFYDSKPWQASAAGLLGSGSAWVAGALIKDMSAQVKISTLLGSLFGNTSPSNVYYLEFLVIGIICSLASLSGRYLRLWS